MSTNSPAEQANGVNVCVQCCNSLYGKRVHSVPEGPERCLIAEIIAPRVIPESGLACYACWLYIRRTLKQRGILAAPTVDINVCVWCLKSLAQKRRHSIPEGPERNEIIARIYPREIPPEGLVCYACWVSARRSVQRAAKIEEREQNPDSSNHRHQDCAWCRMSLHRRQIHTLTSGPLRDEVEIRIYPQELPENALVCSKCWARAKENLRIEQGEVVEQINIEPDTTMRLDGFAHTTQTNSHCFVPACTNGERNRVPQYLRTIILKYQKIFVTENSRVCNEHRSFTNWEFLDQHDFSNTFTQKEIESMLRLSVEDNDI